MNDLRLERRRRGERQVQHGSRSLGVERGAATGGEAVFRQLHGMPLILGIAQRDRELLLRAAQLEVRARHLGGNAHFHICQSVLRGLDDRALRADVSRDASEDVQLPRCIEARVPQLLLRQLAAEAGHLRNRELLSRRAARGGDRRQEIECREAARRSRAR